MTVISIRNPETKNGIVNLIHYGCHGTAAGQQTAISRDWSGIIIDRLEMVTGTITAYWNGAEGDVGPRLTNGRDIGDFQYVEELGGVAASDALRAYQACGVYKPGNLKIYTGHIHIPRKDLLSKETIYAKLALYENPEELINIQKMEYTYYKASADAYEYVNIYTLTKNGDISVSIICFCLIKSAFIPHIKNCHTRRL